MKKLILFLIVNIGILSLHAQSKSNGYYKLHPVWIQMMEDEQVNYYEAVKAFELFWEGKETPTEENELFEASIEEKAQSNFIANKKLKQDEVARRYSFEYKKFKHWQQRVLPFVKEDGSIMSKQEQLELWKQQRQGRK